MSICLTRRIRTFYSASLAAIYMAYQMGKKNPNMPPGAQGQGGTGADGSQGVVDPSAMGQGGMVPAGLIPATGNGVTYDMSQYAPAPQQYAPPPQQYAVPPQQYAAPQYAQLSSEQQFYIPQATNVQQRSVADEDLPRPEVS